MPFLNLNSTRKTSTLGLLSKKSPSPRTKSSFLPATEADPKDSISPFAFLTDTARQEPLSSGFLPSTKPRQSNGFLPTAKPEGNSTRFLPRNQDKPKSKSFLSAIQSSGTTRSSFLPKTENDGTHASAGPKPTANTNPKELSDRSLNAAQTLALAALPAPAAIALKEVWNIMQGAQQPQEHLLELLADGKLAESDRGITVPERLHSIASTDRASGFDSHNLAIETLALLANPEKSVYQGADRLSCGAANMELQLTEQPALLTRIIDELSSPKGSSRIGESTELHRLSSVEEYDGTGRNGVDRLLQGSLMNLAGKANGPYDPLKDVFANGNKGLRVTEIAQTSATLEDQDYAVLVHDGETSKEVRRIINSMPKDETIQLGVSWGDQDHIVTLLERDGDMAKYFDSINHENERMPFADLFFKTQVAVVPAKYVQDIDVPADALYTYSPE